MDSIRCEASDFDREIGGELVLSRKARIGACVCESTSEVGTVLFQASVDVSRILVLPEIMDFESWNWFPFSFLPLRAMRSSWVLG